MSYKGFLRLIFEKSILLHFSLHLKNWLLKGYKICNKCNRILGKILIFGFWKRVYPTPCSRNAIKLKSQKMTLFCYKFYNKLIFTFLSVKKSVTRFSKCFCKMLSFSEVSVTIAIWALLHLIICKSIK